MGDTLIWNLKGTGSKVVLSEKNGIWRVDFDMNQVSFVAKSKTHAEKLALRGLKRYICSLIEDFDKAKTWLDNDNKHNR